MPILFIKSFYFIFILIYFILVLNLSNQNGRCDQQPPFVKDKQKATDHLDIPNWNPELSLSQTCADPHPPNYGPTLPAFSLLNNFLFSFPFESLNALKL